MTWLFPSIQQAEAWHRQGLFMGMHWAWWFFWIALILVLGWAFWRLAAERREARLSARRMVLAEEALRRRFAEGEIDEQELLEGMRTLHATRAPRAIAAEELLSKEE